MYAGTVHDYSDYTSSRQLTLVTIISLVTPCFLSSLGDTTISCFLDVIVLYLGYPIIYNLAHALLLTEVQSVTVTSSPAAVITSA